MGSCSLLQGMFPTQGLNPARSSALQVDSLPFDPPGNDVEYTIKAPSLMKLIQFSSFQFSSVAQSCPKGCDPMNRSTPGFPVHHQLPEFTQTHAHQVGDAIQPSHPLSSPSPPAPNPSHHQGLLQ